MLRTEISIMRTLKKMFYQYSAQKDGVDTWNVTVHADYSPTSSVLYMHFLTARYHDANFMKAYNIASV